MINIKLFCCVGFMILVVLILLENNLLISPFPFLIKIVKKDYRAPSGKDLN